VLPILAYFFSWSYSLESLWRRGTCLGFPLDFRRLYPQSQQSCVHASLLVLLSGSAVACQTAYEDIVHTVSLWMLLRSLLQYLFSI
jgi:hypothetical protein